MTFQRLLPILTMTSAMVLSAAAIAQTSPAPATSSSHAADNTGINTRDRSDPSQTSTAQPNDKSDVKLAAAVRRAITKDSSLSTLGHNVKILAANGSVTLRGPVKSDDEKSKIESLVRSVNGVQQVTNDLDVKP